MIRRACAADLEELIEIGKVMHGESRFARISFDEDKVRATLTWLLNSGQCLLVFERDGALIGGIGGAAVEFYWSRAMYAADLALFVHPGARGGLAAMRLIEAFKEWAIERGCVELTIGISTGVQVERTSLLLERLGFTASSPLYYQEIRHVH